MSFAIDSRIDMQPAVLSRVQAFLPELAASNAELARRAREDPKSVDIENTAADERYIEMASSLLLFVCLPVHHLILSLSTDRT